MQSPWRTSVGILGDELICHNLAFGWRYADSRPRMAPTIVSRQYFGHFRCTFFQVGYGVDDIFQSLHLGVSIGISAGNRRSANRVAAVSFLLQQNFVLLILIDNSAFQHDAPLVLTVQVANCVTGSPQPKPRRAARRRGRRSGPVSRSAVAHLCAFRGGSAIATCQAHATGETKQSTYRSFNRPIRQGDERCLCGGWLVHRDYRQPYQCAYRQYYQGEQSHDDQAGDDSAVAHA